MYYMHMLCTVFLGVFLYMDNALHTPGEKARLVSPTFVETDFKKCFSFEYRVNDMAEGEIKVSDQNEVVIWHKKFTPGKNEWMIIILYIISH